MSTSRTQWVWERLRLAPRMIYESALEWWKHGKLGLALAGLFVAAVIALVWLG